jgi:hypothetical protein
VTAQPLSLSIPISYRVIEMEKIVPQKKGSLARRMLEVLGITRACVQSIGTQEEDTVCVNLPLNYSDWKTIEAALLEAEHQKARAITQMRRQQFV